jgi:hypothetical protein
MDRELRRDTAKFLRTATRPQLEKKLLSLQALVDLGVFKTPANLADAQQILAAIRAEIELR